MSHQDLASSRGAEILLAVGCRHQAEIGASVVVFALLHVCAGVREGRHKTAIRFAGQTAGMVKVEMGDGDVGHAGGVDVQGQQARTEPIRGGDAEDTLLLGVELVAASGLDDEAPVAAGPFDKQAVAGELDAVVLVGGKGARPDRLGDEAEHSAAVEFEVAAGDERDGASAEVVASGRRRDVDRGGDVRGACVGRIRGCAHDGA